ncbi:hypothetical protein MLD38_030474 [Melastoma candidum]|uniref:Uncharacterized protein n=1 Tax=Melastoma candidum TaxID=119954 RepID=A0ACB9MMZ6_9MYRT|nr:hypothetical protein MLD38_030474 [Melastoma candidum]
MKPEADPSSSSLHLLTSSLYLSIITTFLLLLTLTSARPHPPSSLPTIIPEGLYNTLFPHKDDAACPASGFYPYEVFLRAASRYPRFANTGCPDTRRREVAAFLAQTSHETTGGWPTAPDGPYAMGILL